MTGDEMGEKSEDLRDGGMVERYRVLSYCHIVYQ